MKVVNLAGDQSAWRGYEYYKNGNVISCEQIDDGVYRGKVSGSNGAVYDIMLDINHPRSSRTSCTCPFAKDSKYRVCKHMVALYFMAFPDDIDEFKRSYIEAQNQFGWSND